MAEAIHSANRPYNDIATDLIAAQGTNSYDSAQGHLNWIVNGLVTNGPAQDAYDQEAANTAETFLGVTHLNCTLCHNGRGHLDSLSLWGKSEARTTSWGLAALFCEDQHYAHAGKCGGKQSAVLLACRGYGRSDYQYGTLTGNRPARCVNNPPPMTVNNLLTCDCVDGSTPAVTNGRATCRAGFGTAAPVYPFNGHTPKSGENYRVALAREVTGDFQFARASVNYIWKEFFRAAGLSIPPISSI